MWIALLALTANQEVLICPEGSKGSQNSLAHIFPGSLAYLFLMLSLGVFYPCQIHLSNSAQQSEPFLLLLNICQICTAAWRMERLGRVSCGPFLIQCCFVLL